MTDHTFEVTDVFRIASRQGPILIGRLSGGDLGMGDQLVSHDIPTVTLEVIGYELHAPADSPGVMVRPDIPERLIAGAVFRVRPRDIRSR